MPEYMYACHVSSTVTCQYYTSRTYYHNESPISFLPELFRIWPRDTRAISIRLCFSSIERYKIIRVYTLSLWKTEFPEPSSDKKGIIVWTDREEIASTFFVRVTFARTYNAYILCVYCVSIAIIAEGLRFESRDQNKRNREENETRVFANLRTSFVIDHFPLLD